MARVIVSPAAESDVLEIWGYIARDSPVAADRIVDRFDALFRKLALSPGIGKSADELDTGLRMFPTGNYLVFYRSNESDIEIVRW